MNNAVDVIFKLKEKLSSKDVEIDRLEMKLANKSIECENLERLVAFKQMQLEACEKTLEKYSNTLIEYGYTLLDE